MIKILLICVLFPFMLMAQAVVVENTPCTAYSFPAVSPLVFRLPIQNGFSPNNWMPNICGGGSEDNPAWWKFQPPGNSVTITVEMYNCFNFGGSQITVWKQEANCNSLTAVDCYFPLGYAAAPYVWTISTVPNSQYFIQFDGVNENQCSFNVGFTASALPVELLNFEAEVQQKQVLLHWQTASEQNNAFFDIERSNDGVHFESIGSQPGNGTTKEVHNYSFIDEKPLLGMNYYRLKQNDIDGNFEYSKIISEDFKPKISFEISPNPTNDKILVKRSSFEEGILTLFNAQGQAILSEQLFNKESFMEISLGEIPKGVYFLQLEESGIKKLHKVVKY